MVTNHYESNEMFFEFSILKISFKSKNLNVNLCTKKFLQNDLSTLNCLDGFMNEQDFCKKFYFTFVQNTNMK